MLTSDHEDDHLAFEYPGVAIPPPAALVEAEIMQETRIGIVGQIREQPELVEKELRQRGTWAYDLLCKNSKTLAVPSETSPLAHMPLLKSGMAGPPLPPDRHPMTKLADESDTAYDSRMQERQNYFERNVHWKKQEQTETETLPFVPVAQTLGLKSSGNVCPGPTGGGNLSFEETKMALLHVLSDEECSALLAVLPRCQKHSDSLCWKPESGLKKPLGCGAGKKCNRPHAVSADDLYGDIDPEQLKYWKIQKKINTDKKGLSVIPFGRLTRKKPCTEDSVLTYRLQPPVQEALQLFFQKHGFEDLLATAHLRENHLGNQILQVRVRRGIYPIGDAALKLGDPKVCTLNDLDVIWSADNPIHRSGNTVPKLTFHGTSPDVFIPIMRAGGLVPDPRGVSTPKAVFVCQDVRTAEMSMYNKGLIVVCKTVGFPFNYEIHRNRLREPNTIPNGCVAFLREVQQTKQIAAHPRSLQAVEFIFDLHALVKMVDEELENLGYTQRYHEKVTKILRLVHDRWQQLESSSS